MAALFCAIQQLPSSISRSIFSLPFTFNISLFQGPLVAVMVDGNINKENEEEPSFSDPEDFVDKISDQGTQPLVLLSTFFKFRACS